MFDFLFSFYYSLYDIPKYVNDFIETSKFWFPLILSIISALIFWIVFSYYPIKKREKRLRPIIELDIYSVQHELFALFDLIFKINLHSASLFQEDIHSGKLEKEDFLIALQNKCLNDTYKYPLEIAPVYLSIGANILSRYDNIENLIGKITNLNQYVYSEELLLLEQIRTNIKMYNLNEKNINENAIYEVNDKQMKAVVSNLGYMHQQIFELYNLYKALQKLIFIKTKYENRNIFLHKIQYLFYTEQFKKCKRIIKSGKNKFENTIELMDHYNLLCDYKLSKLDYKKVEIILNKKYYNGSLVSSRSFFKELINDKQFYTILKKIYSEVEIERLHNVLNHEKSQKEAFLKMNKNIKSFFNKA